MNRIKTIVAVYVLIFSFLVAHLVSVVAAHQLSVPPSSPRVEGSATTPIHTPGLLLSQAQDLLTSRLFSLPPSASKTPALETGSSSATEPTAAPPAAPIDAAKKIKLVGVVVTEGRAPFAIIEDLTSKKQRLYHLHDDIPGIGSLRAIGRDAVVIEQGAQREILELDIRKHEKPLGPSISPSVGQVAGSGALRRTLDQREVAASVADLPKLLSQARATPHYTEGKLDGWRIETITPQSFYDKIGLHAGDILTRVNGVEIRDPGMMLALFQQVKSEKSVKVDVIRDNRRTSLDYEIR